MSEKTIKLPAVRKNYFEHGLQHTKASQAALKTLASSVHSLRKASGMSLKDLAEKVGCSYQVIHHIESADNFPSLAVYLAICRVFGFPNPPMT